MRAEPSSRPQARNLFSPFLVLFAAILPKRTETVFSHKQQRELPMQGSSLIHYVEVILSVLFEQRGPKRTKKARRHPLPRVDLRQPPSICFAPPYVLGVDCTFCTAQKVRKKAYPFVFSGCGVVCSLNRQTSMPIPSARHSDEFLVLDPPPNPRLGGGFVAFGSEL